MLACLRFDELEYECILSSCDGILQLAKNEKNPRMHEMCVSKMCSNMLSFLRQKFVLAMLSSSPGIVYSNILHKINGKMNKLNFSKKSALCHFFSFRFLSDGLNIPWPLGTYQTFIARGSKQALVH